jgi:hypothetical protein
MTHGRVGIALVLALLMAVSPLGCGVGGEYYYFDDDDFPEVVVLISSAASPLVPNQRNSILIRVLSAGESEAWDVVLQFSAPIGFRYESVTCRSSGPVLCPPVSVQQLAGGVFVGSFPPSSELGFVFDGVTTGDVGTQVAITGVAKVDWDKDTSNNSELLYIPIVAPVATPVR